MSTDMAAGPSSTPMRDSSKPNPKAKPLSTPNGSTPHRAFTAFRSVVANINTAEGDEEGEIAGGELITGALADSVFLDDTMDRDAKRKVVRSEKKAEKQAEKRAEKAEHEPTPVKSKAERSREPVMVEIDGLLLPQTVRLNEHDAEGNEIEEESVGSVEGVHFVDDDVPGLRYWDEPEEDDFLATADQAQLCRRCKKPGHIERDCPHIVCLSCGAEDEHETRACPFKTTCFACGKIGHMRQDCPDPKSKYTRGGCRRCGVYDHTASTCPLIWRVYCFLRASDRDAMMEKKADTTSWEKEAVGGGAGERWCYNCAREGHFGEDCPQPRGTRARAIINSAFSEAIVSRSPYANSRSAGYSGTHTRWDDDASLPYEAEGFKGANAGKKTAERERQRARDADRQRDNIRDRGGGGGGRNHNQNYNQRGREAWFDSPRGGWDSDRRRSRSPPRRGRGYDSDRDGRDVRNGGGGGRISVGKITGRSLADRIGSPGDARRGGNASQGGPGGGAGAGARGGAGAGDSMLRRALASAGDRAPPSGNGKGNRRDFEREWRESGAGGGNVSSWGREMDRMERDERRDRERRERGGERMRDDRTRAGPQRPARGQKYTGGY